MTAVAHPLLPVKGEASLLPTLIRSADARVLPLAVTYHRLSTLSLLLYSLASRTYFLTSLLKLLPFLKSLYFSCPNVLTIVLRSLPSRKYSLVLWAVPATIEG